jgi:hypothetical protein
MSKAGASTLWSLLIKNVLLFSKLLSILPVIESGIIDPIAEDVLKKKLTSILENKLGLNFS